MVSVPDLIILEHIIVRCLDMVPILLIYHVQDTRPQVYNPITPMARIFEPGFLLWFLWSRTGVFIDWADRCSCDHCTVLHVSSKCYY